MKLLTKFVNIINKVIDFFNTDYNNDYTPVTDYPWIEINSNLNWCVNTNHPEFIKNIVGFKCVADNVKIVATVTEGKLKGRNGYTRNTPILENYTKPKPPPCPPAPPSREYKCTFFGFVETQESIDKTNKYREEN